eukprot:GHUV01036900.1.p1 GENE.GHUV01036900.1~~GHUV01036900.1.p1  ORF type:complete len:141 (+),score=39.17 GHUV01036900.1:405-827(+)
MHKSLLGSVIIAVPAGYSNRHEAILLGLILLLQQALTSAPTCDCQLGHDVEGTTQVEGCHLTQIQRGSLGGKAHTHSKHQAAQHKHDHVNSTGNQSSANKEAGTTSHHRGLATIPAATDHKTSASDWPSTKLPALHGTQH